MDFITPSLQLKMETKRFVITEETIKQSAELLCKGELVAFPTDTVYGVGTNAYHRGGIRRLYEAKGRPATKGIPILIADWEQLAQVTAQPIATWLQKILQRHWPGALTIIVSRHPDLPSELSPNNDIAVRLPNCEATRQLIRAVGQPLATSSANRSAEPPATTADMAQDALNGRVAIILDGGATPGAIPSTILDCTLFPPVILREGMISAETLLNLQEQA